MGFHEESSKTDIDNIVNAFLKLKDSIPQIEAMEWGTDVSPEGLQQGITHAFLLTFASEEDRDIYLPHPEHTKFSEQVKPHLVAITVVDYWAI